MKPSPKRKAEESPSGLCLDTRVDARERPSASTIDAAAGVQSLQASVVLWRELTDEVFEEQFRQRYFGTEVISRQEAIDRLIASDAIDANKKSLNASNGPHESPSTEAFCKTSETRGDEPGLTGLQLVMLPSRRPPWRSMLLSIVVHGLMLALLTSIRLPRSKNRIIDFDTDTITYYKTSQLFPNVAPLEKEVTHQPSESKPQANSHTQEEVQIRPKAASQSEIVIEQPNVRQISALPKLALPNILMQTSKMDPGREPLVAPPDVLRHLALDVQQSQSLTSLPQNTAPGLPDRQPALALPQIAAPAAPSAEALEVSQLAGQFGRLQQRAAPLPYAAPPVEDSTASFQVEGVPTQGPSLLVFSTSPRIPEGEIAVPKVSSTGRLTGSPRPADPTVLPPGAVELGRAEVVMPAISINSRTAPSAVGAGGAMVQAPVARPPLTPKPPGLASSTSLLDFLPSRIPSTRPLTPTSTGVGSGDSPLQEYESRGGPVYTAAINAPNFTSKRGSWIFRFAELTLAEPTTSAGTPAASLTAPSAVVKVDPKYAPEIVREKLEGVVVLFAVLRKDGTIDGESVRVIRKLDDRLDLSARDALLSWRFRPSQRNGTPVDIQMEVSIPFYFRKEGQ